MVLTFLHLLRFLGDAGEQKRQEADLKGLNPRWVAESHPRGQDGPRTCISHEVPVRLRPLVPGPHCK